MNRTAWNRGAAAAALAVTLAACAGAGTPQPHQATGASPTAATAMKENATSAAATASASPIVPSPGTAETRTVMISNFAFAEDELTIPAGSTIEWMNMDGTRHTASEGSDGTVAADAAFDLDLEAGATGAHTFDERGTVSVTCDIHPTMNMVITVE